jgi:hypothetical protein
MHSAMSRIVARAATALLTSDWRPKVAASVVAK